MHSYADVIEMKRANVRNYASFTLSSYIFIVREELKAV